MIIHAEGSVGSVQADSQPMTLGKYAWYTPQGINISSKKYLAMKSGNKSWQKEIERINVMRSHEEGSTCNV